MLEEVDAHPDGEFPCCIKCGGFVTRNAPLTPAQAESIIETIEHGHPVSGLQRHDLAAILTAHGYEAPEPYSDPGSSEAHGMDSAQIGSIRIGSATEILRNKGGHTVELACYQAAMKRRSGADPAAKVIICCAQPGTFRGLVLMSQQHEKPEKRGRIDDPVVDARPQGGCGCVISQEAT